VLYRFAIELDDWENFSPLEQRRVQWNVIRALVGANADWLRGHPDAPLLYEAGVRFIPEDQPFVLNRWQSIPTVLAAGGSHCVGLCAWRVAELRERYGENARPAILEFEEDREEVGLLQEWHFVVKRADGSYEDPSKCLGMP